MCAWHGTSRAGSSPAMAHGGWEHIDESKGARRNAQLLPEERITADESPMRDLKEAVVKTAT